MSRSLLPVPEPSLAPGPDAFNASLKPPLLTNSATCPGEHFQPLNSLFNPVFERSGIDLLTCQPDHLEKRGQGIDVRGLAYDGIDCGDHFLIARIREFVRQQISVGSQQDVVAVSDIVDRRAGFDAEGSKQLIGASDAGPRQRERRRGALRRSESGQRPRCFEGPVRGFQPGTRSATRLVRNSCLQRYRDGVSASELRRSELYSKAKFNRN